MELSQGDKSRACAMSMETELGRVTRRRKLVCEATGLEMNAASPYRPWIETTLLCFVREWAEAYAAACSLPFSHTLEPPRMAALIDVRFSLGATPFAVLTRVIELLERGEYAAAAHALLHSRWHGEDREACERDARMIRTGEW
jgi:hypothetical protein